MDSKHHNRHFQFYMFLVGVNVFSYYIAPSKEYEAIPLIFMLYCGTMGFLHMRMSQFKESREKQQDGNNKGN